MGVSAVKIMSVEQLSPSRLQIVNYPLDERTTTNLTPHQKIYLLDSHQNQWMANRLNWIASARNKTNLKHLKFVVKE